MGERIGFGLGHTGDDDEEPGWLDHLARLEEILHGGDFNAACNEVAAQIRIVGEIMQEANTDRMKGPDTFARRVQVLRRLALRLENPANELSTLVSKLTPLMDDIDEGFKVAIMRAPAEVAENPDARKAILPTFNDIRVFSEGFRYAYESSQILIDSMAPLMKTSKVVRPVLRRLRHSLAIAVDHFQLADNWILLIEESGIDC